MTNGEFTGSSLLRLALLLLLSTPAFASGGTVRGVVVDPVGAVVPNAHIRILYDTGETAVEGTTGQDGTFSLISPAGSLALAVHASGFKLFRKELNVTEAAVTQLEVKLAVGCFGDLTQLIPKRLEARTLLVEISHWGSFGCPETVYRLWGTGEASAWYVDCRGKKRSMNRRIDPSELASALTEIADDYSGPVCGDYPGGIDAPKVEVTILAGSQPRVVISHDEADNLKILTPFEQRIEKLVDPGGQVRRRDSGATK